jgi:hypothetical protein
MSIDKDPRCASNASLLAAPLLLFAGVSLAIGLLASHANHEPYQTPFFHLFFSNTLHMKAWLTTGPRSWASVNWRQRPESTESCISRRPAASIRSRIAGLVGSPSS